MSLAVLDATISLCGAIRFSRKPGLHIIVTSFRSMSDNVDVIFISYPIWRLALYGTSGTISRPHCQPHLSPPLIRLTRDGGRGL